MTREVNGQHGAAGVADDVTEIPPSPPPDIEPAELENPTLDIHTQFAMYNEKYFANRIKNTTVEYSTRMTLCAGTCSFRPPKIRIALSEPLLKLRPRSDLLSTLLHEMIHAYLFITDGLSRDGPDGHGPKFMSHAERISTAEPGVHITPYHAFSAEVDHYRVHHWECNRCQRLIKRAMNRAPAPTDPFWPDHQQSCGGEFVKVSEPPKKVKPVRAPKNGAVAVADGENAEVALPKGVMRTFRIDDMLSRHSAKAVKRMVDCPVCSARVKHHLLNDHLDMCLSDGLFTQAPHNVANNRKDEVNREQESGAAVPPGSRDREDVTYKSRRPGAPNSGSCHLSSASPVSSSMPVSRNEQQRRTETNTPTTTHGDHDSENRDHSSCDDPLAYIADPDALFDLAVAPHLLTADRKSSMFRRSVPQLKPTKKPGLQSNFAVILKPLLQPESSYEIHVQARAHIKPLIIDEEGREFSFHHVAERLGMSWPEVMKLVRAESTIGKDGSYVLSAKLLSRFSSSSPSSAQSSALPPTKRPKRAPGVATGNIPRRSVQVALRYPEPPQKLHAAEASILNRNSASAPPRKEHIPNASYSTGECPICDQTIRKSELRQHVDRCLTDSEVAQNIFRDSEGKKTVDVNDRHRQASSPKSGGDARPSAGPATGRNPRCPICDLALPRADLESHVAACMMSTGLADAF